MRSIIFLLILLSKLSIAAPWWTGPLLAPSGKTIAAGHVNYEPYGFYTKHPRSYQSLQTTQIISIGLINRLDFQLSVPIDHSWIDQQNGGGIGDINAGIGIQVLDENKTPRFPDLRVLLQEIFPTGRYNHLNPQKKGTDQTGAGVYQTHLSFNFQKTYQLYNFHYMRTRLSLAGSKSTGVSVRGLNAYGGGFLTKGKIEPTTSYSIDLAFEYSLTQHWVPVFEALFLHNSPVNFNGRNGFTPGRMLAGIGGKQLNLLSLAPALEYNFNSRIGVIGGAWFLIYGPHPARFTSGVIAVNFYI